MPEHGIHDVLVIGAGQAGLALAWHLRRAPLSTCASSSAPGASGTAGASGTTR